MPHNHSILPTHSYKSFFLTLTNLFSNSCLWLASQTYCTSLLTKEIMVYPDILLCSYSKRLCLTFSAVLDHHFQVTISFVLFSVSYVISQTHFPFFILANFSKIIIMCRFIIDCLWHSLSHNFSILQFPGR